MIKKLLIYRNQILVCVLLFSLLYTMFFNINIYFVLSLLILPFLFRNKKHKITFLITVVLTLSIIFIIRRKEHNYDILIFLKLKNKKVIKKDVLSPIDKNEKDKTLLNMTKNLEAKNKEDNKEEKTECDTVSMIINETKKDDTPKIETAIKPIEKPVSTEIVSSDLSKALKITIPEYKYLFIYYHAKTESDLKVSDLKLTNDLLYIIEGVFLNNCYYEIGINNFLPTLKDQQSCFKKIDVKGQIKDLYNTHTDNENFKNYIEASSSVDLKLICVCIAFDIITFIPKCQQSIKSIEDIVQKIFQFIKCNDEEIFYIFFDNDGYKCRNGKIIEET
ncbi:hypothetical protein TCON_0922 [Astathelohania contejeani]|uniref:Uncharacterized protein n=1 Tax=Astathelohania contejeani TaxID=164912 RepID=A0ABQ7I0C4_9MICR|nr:hypothetical protein TCON_0922 [Thelohania contejeani]